MFDSHPLLCTDSYRSGTDRSIRYWEVYDGSMVREIEGSKFGPVNCLAINSTGDYFVSSGNDCIVKLWNYELGEVVGIVKFELLI